MNIIESCLISNKEHIKEVIDEESLIKKEITILTKKYDLSKYEDKTKIIKSLISKGFDYELIKKKVKEGIPYEND